MDVQPFTVDIPESVLQDLRERLERTRWPDDSPDSGWDYGSNLAYVRELVEYWRTEFDWRAQEQAINRLAHYRTNVDGSGIHFILERGRGPAPLPIVLSHGWPSTFSEMLKIISLLTDPAAHGGDPADSFDVIVPSLPGYGFSDLTTERSVNVARIADLWARLMTEKLGYSRFGAHGGDWGAAITGRLGHNYPELLVGIHVTAVALLPYLGPGAPELSDAERAFLDAREEWVSGEGGYAHLQGTKPQTLSYGLNDSPAGLAAWIVEKFRTWSDCDGDVEARFSKDELLTNITVYWATQTINSSTRMYYESRRSGRELPRGERVEVPCAVAQFPKDLGYPPREWAERVFNLQRWTEMPRGGHFAALEEPEMLVDDLRAFFRILR
jgi:pimeloyl-ACP methyl ester carboxylesterase